jgi:hypothetical protein
MKWEEKEESQRMVPSCQNSISELPSSSKDKRNQDARIKRILSNFSLLLKYKIACIAII